MAWNPHKMLVAGLQCSILLLRDTTVWSRTLRNHKDVFLVLVSLGNTFNNKPLFFFLLELVETVSQRQRHLSVPARQILRRQPGRGGQVGAVQP